MVSVISKYSENNKKVNQII